MGTENEKAARDNRSNQLNSTHPGFHRSRGESPAEAERSAEKERAKEPSKTPEGESR